MIQKNNLFLIPARGGSKGIPNKNIKLLKGKPLIQFSLKVVDEVITDEDVICVSSDDDKIIETVENLGYKVPFKRPKCLATDDAGSYGVILHALNYFEEQGIAFDKVVLIQPTSPLRKAQHVKESLELYNEELDMVVSVKESEANPYVNLFELNDQGYLEKSKKGNFDRRQDAPVVYQYNGAIFVMNVNSLRLKSHKDFKVIQKYLMKERYSIDLDTELDWNFAEFLLTSSSYS